MQPVVCPPANVLIAHPEPLMCMGLARSLQDRPDLRVLGPGEARDDQPIDVVLTNYADGLQRAGQAAGAARTRRPRILVVAGEAREQEVRRALELGVHGYILRGASPEEVLAGVRSLASGQRYVCRAAAERMADGMVRHGLTARESEVLALLATGLCNKTIARRLDIAVGTVKQHVKGIMAKLQASSRTHAVSIAMARGLLAGGPARKA